MESPTPTIPAHMKNSTPTESLTSPPTPVLSSNQSRLNRISISGGRSEIPVERGGLLASTDKRDPLGVFNSDDKASIKDISEGGVANLSQGDYLAEAKRARRRPLVSPMVQMQFKVQDSEKKPVRDSPIRRPQHHFASL